MSAANSNTIDSKDCKQPIAENSKEASSVVAKLGQTVPASKKRVYWFREVDDWRAGPQIEFWEESETVDGAEYHGSLEIDKTDTLDVWVLSDGEPKKLISLNGDADVDELCLKYFEKKNKMGPFRHDGGYTGGYHPTGQYTNRKFSDNDLKHLPDLPNDSRWLVVTHLGRIVDTYSLNSFSVH